MDFPKHAYALLLFIAKVQIQIGILHSFRSQLLGDKRPFFSPQKVEGIFFSSFEALSERCLTSSRPRVRTGAFSCKTPFNQIFFLGVCLKILLFLATPSSLKKVPLSPVIKERLSRLFCIFDHSRANLLSAENLMASGIISLGNILARARAAALLGEKKTDGSSAAAQQPETRARKKGHLIQVEEDPSLEEAGRSSVVSLHRYLQPRSLSRAPWSVRVLKPEEVNRSFFPI